MAHKTVSKTTKKHIKNFMQRTKKILVTIAGALTCSALILYKINSAPYQTEEIKTLSQYVSPEDVGQMTAVPPKKLEEQYMLCSIYNQAKKNYAPDTLLVPFKYNLTAFYKRKMEYKGKTFDTTAENFGQRIEALYREMGNRGYLD